VPGQSSRSLERLASKRERPGRRPLSPALASDGRSESLRAHGRLCGFALRFQEARPYPERGQKEARRPAARTPSLPWCPSPPAVLPSRGVSRRRSGTTRLSHTPAWADNASEVEALPNPKFGVVVGADAAGGPAPAERPRATARRNRSRRGRLADPDSLRIARLPGTCVLTKGKRG
jgi:hypothetical protein